MSAETSASLRHTKMRNVMMNISWTHKGNTAKLTRLVLALNKTLSRMA